MKRKPLLENKVCLVTGTSRGIGQAIAERFAEERAVVYANARTGGSIDEWAARCAERCGAAVIPVYFDVRDADGGKQAVMRIKNEHGRVDALVNNAAIERNELIGMLDMNYAREVFDVNVMAPIRLIQLVSRIMTRQAQGSIINIASMVGLKGSAGQSIYAASKGALISFTRCAAIELASHNVRVNAVAPGLTQTEMLAQAAPEHLEDRIAHIKMGRLAKPREIADACVYLASDLSSFVSGQVLGVDGCSII